MPQSDAVRFLRLSQKVILLPPCLLEHSLVCLEHEVWDLQLPCCEETKPCGEASGLSRASLAFKSFQPFPQTCEWMTIRWCRRCQPQPLNQPQRHPWTFETAWRLQTWCSREKPSLVCALWIPGSENVSTIKWLLFSVSKFGVVCYVTIIGTVIKPERSIVSVRSSLVLKLIKVGTTRWINVYWFFFHFKWG